MIVVASPIVHQDRLLVHVLKPRKRVLKQERCKKKKKKKKEEEDKFQKVRRLLLARFQFGRRQKEKRLNEGEAKPSCCLSAG